MHGWMSRAAVVAMVALLGCDRSNNEVQDGSIRVDARTSDAGAADARVLDAASRDAGRLDAGFADAAELDAAEPDAAEPDAAEPDAAEPDAAESDAEVPDAGPAVCTVAPNSCANGEVCLGESCSCIERLEGSHYLRTNGTVVHWNGPGRVITVAGGAELADVRQIYSGNAHGCARKTDNTVWCWPTSAGGNASGQLGNGSIIANLTNADLFIATQVMDSTGFPITDVVQINRGASRGYAASNTCAVRLDGTLWCWGSPDASGGGGGTLFNDGVAGHRPSATQIMADATNPLTGVLEVSVGLRHACVIRNGTTNRELWCWAANIGGPLGQGDQVGRLYPVQVTLPGPVDQLGAGADATCVRIADAVYCWGSNNSGQVGIGGHTLPANHDGCINYCKLTPRQVVQANDVPLTGVVEYNMGYLNSCARLADHSLWCWGNITAVQRTDWAIQAVVGGNALDNVALQTTYNTGGYAESMLYMTRDNQLLRANAAVTQLCP